MAELTFPERMNAATVFIDANVEAGRGEKTAILCGDQAVTYDQLLANVNRVGNALLGLELLMEQRVAILMPDSPECAYAFFGAMKIGAVAIPLNTIREVETDLNWKYRMRNTMINTSGMMIESLFSARTWFS